MGVKWVHPAISMYNIWPPYQENLFQMGLKTHNRHQTTANRHSYSLLFRVSSILHSLSVLSACFPAAVPVFVVEHPRPILNTVPCPMFRCCVQLWTHAALQTTLGAGHWAGPCRGEFCHASSSAPIFKLSCCQRWTAPFLTSQCCIYNFSSRR